MTITISAQDSNGDGKGINFSTFFSSFFDTFVDPQNEQQYAAGFQYALYRETGQSILFNGTEHWTVDPYTGPGDPYSGPTSGNFNEIVFGDNFQSTEGNPATNSADLTIRFPSVIDESTQIPQALALGGGIDKLMDYFRADKIHFKGSNGSDVFTGFGLADRLDGNDGNDRLGGAGGKDVIDGGGGNDILTGGEAADTFQFDLHGGSDKITDFEAGGRKHDVIEFSSDIFANFKQVLHAADDGKHGLTIAYGADDTLLLAHIKIEDLDKADFHFA